MRHASLIRPTIKISIQIIFHWHYWTAAEDSLKCCCFFLFFVVVFVMRKSTHWIDAIEFPWIIHQRWIKEKLCNQITLFLFFFSHSKYDLWMRFKFMNVQKVNTHREKREQKKTSNHFTAIKSLSVQSIVFYVWQVQKANLMRKIEHARKRLCSYVKKKQRPGEL